MIKDSDDAQIIRPSEFEKTKEALTALRLRERLKIERQTHRDLAVVVHQSLEEICTLEETLEKCRLDMRKADEDLEKAKKNGSAARHQSGVLIKRLRRTRTIGYLLALTSILLAVVSWPRISEQITIWLPAAAEWLPGVFVVS
ncbi:MAG: hypothetical protein ACR2PF_08760 [Rhizobiaceae bacterium]